MATRLRHILAATLLATLAAVTLVIPACAKPFDGHDGSLAAAGINHELHHHVGGQALSPTSVLLAAINTMREKRHLRPFVKSSKLSGCARKHSVVMANTGRDGSLFHNLSGDACITYVDAGENIGYASGLPATAVLSTFTAMMAEGPCPTKCAPDSALWEKHGHFLNLTSKVYTTIGVGVYTKYYSDLGMRLTWVTEDFVQP